MSAPRNGNDGPCPSDHHGADRPAATVPGLFSSKHINGREPERCTYCLRCACVGYVSRVFTPDSAALRDEFEAWDRRRPAARTPRARGRDDMRGEPGQT